MIALYFAILSRFIAGCSPRFYADGSAVGVDSKRLTPRADLAAQVRRRDGAGDRHLQVVHGDGAGRSRGLEVEVHSRVERNAHSAAGRSNLAAARVALGKAYLDRTAGGVGVNLASGILDADRAARGVRQEVALDFVELDGAAAGPGLDRAAQGVAFDSAARSIDPGVARDALELNAPA